MTTGGPRSTGSRGGFVLAELLVALMIAAIIGVSLTQLVVSQSRFVALQGALMQARSGARAALNVVATDLRMVTDSGLVQADPESVTVRAPYAFGVTCAQWRGRQVASLLPADSASFAQATPSGYAWRDSTGNYVFVQGVTLVVNRFALVRCNVPPSSVTTLSAPGWSAEAVSLAPSDPRTPPGTVLYLYQLVRYAFAPSAQLPGRIGLWRTVLTTGQRDELVAPFDSSARFLFLDSVYAAHPTPPANLTAVRGLRLVLSAASEAAPEGRTLPMRFNLTTDVVFRNHQ